MRSEYALFQNRIFVPLLENFIKKKDQIDKNFKFFKKFDYPITLKNSVIEILKFRFFIILLKTNSLWHQKMGFW